MRILLTGEGGFMGVHVVPAIRDAFGASAEVLATNRDGNDRDGVVPLDIIDIASLRATLAEFRPTHVFSLVGIAAPGQAGREADLAWQLHLDAVRRFGAALLELAPSAQFFNTGTGLVYGDSFGEGQALDESAALRPRDEYAASKAAGDLALGVLARKGLRCVIMRPFNQIGPGQSEDFVVPAFAAQVARIEAGRAEPVIRVGNLDAERDFVDVRDVAKAYVAALRRSGDIPSGTVFNLASGTPRRIGAVLAALLALTPAPIRVEPDPARFRASDLPRALGNARRAGDQLGWAPGIPFDETLQAVLDEQRRRVGT
jgi:GDP-4-dehydro-6-deoxy-D-mannose reductase